MRKVLEKIEVCYIGEWGGVTTKYENILYYIFPSGLKIEAGEYRYIKGKIKKKKVKMSIEDYYYTQEAKRLLNE